MEGLMLVAGLALVAYVGYVFWKKKGEDVKDVVDDVKDKFNK